MTMTDSIRIETERILLRTMVRADLPTVSKWMGDEELRRNIGVTAPSDLASIEEWFDGVIADENRVWFSVVRKDDDRLIGEAGLIRIFQPWRASDASVIIAEADCVGKGYGSEIMGLLLDYAFGTLGLHRVGIGVFDFNKRAIRFYEKMGFRREGVLRHGYVHNGPHDVILMSILDDERGATAQ